MSHSPHPLSQTLGEREAYRERYQRERDPICADRLLWRAQTFRHLVHLLPGQSVLELGCGHGAFTRQLVRVSRGQNPITAVAFDPPRPPAARGCRSRWSSSPPATTCPPRWKGGRSTSSSARDLLDRRELGRMLQHVHELLKPGGHVLLYESNPWNPVLKVRRALHRLTGNTAPTRGSCSAARSSTS